MYALLFFMIQIYLWMFQIIIAIGLKLLEYSIIISIKILEVFLPIIAKSVSWIAVLMGKRIKRLIGVGKSTSEDENLQLEFGVNNQSKPPLRLNLIPIILGLLAFIITWELGRGQIMLLPIDDFFKGLVIIVSSYIVFILVKKFFHMRSIKKYIAQN